MRKVVEFDVEPGKIKSTWLSCDKDYNLTIYAYNGSPNTETVQISCQSSISSGWTSLSLEIPYGNASRFLAYLPVAVSQTLQVEIHGFRNTVSRLQVFVDTDKSAKFDHHSS